MYAKIKVTHLIATVIIEKCTTQFKSSILEGVGYLPASILEKKEMITVEKKEQIRRAHYVEGKSIRQIRRETGLPSEDDPQGSGEQHSTAIHTPEATFQSCAGSSQADH